MDQFTDSPAHKLRTAYLLMHRATNRQFQSFGMTADQYVVLRLLGGRDGISQQALGQQCASDATTIGRMLNLMESKKLVRRVRSEQDRRTRLVYITDAGRQMTQELYAAAESIRGLLSDTLPADELKQLLSGLEALSAAFEERSSGRPRAASRLDTT